MNTAASFSPSPTEAAHAFSPDALALHRPLPWAIARMISLGICVMASCALVFAWLAPVDIVVSSQGRVIPSGRSKVVQPLESGVVRAIAVRDGQSVKAGDLLVELDPTSAQADQSRVQRDFWDASADASRLHAETAGGALAPWPADMPTDVARQQEALLASKRAEQAQRLATLDADVARREADRDAIATNIDQLRQSLPLLREKHAMREDLATTGHLPRTGTIESRLELMAMEKELAVQQNRLREAEAGRNAALQQRAQARAEFRARAGAELNDAIRKRETARQELVKATLRGELQTLRSPIDGVVQQLAVTTVGGVVTPAQPLMTIVPAGSGLEVEAQVLNKDIGHIRQGQRVINKVETYDYTRYGYIEGRVSWVGTDAVNDSKLGPVYPVRIEMADTSTPNAVNGRRGTVGAGMNVTADIRTGERRMLEYFLAPMLRYQQEAIRER